MLGRAIAERLERVLRKVGTGFPIKTRTTKNFEPIPIPSKRDRL